VLDGHDGDLVACPTDDADVAASGAVQTLELDRRACPPAGLGEGADRAGGTRGASGEAEATERPPDRSRGGLTSDAALEPPKGIEPLTYSLRVNRSGRLS
jgi:hypothetical protein